MTDQEKLIIRIKIMDKTESIVKHALTMGAIVWSISIIADKIDQIANIVYALLFAIIIFIIYTTRLKKFIGNKIKQMANHNQKLEKSIDSKRTSSQLTEQGQTNPLDK
jgi:ABC-type long-subunit fatty acid transport system fused permease/ATPase subunit